MHCVHTAALTDSIDATCALFEPNGVPWQLEVDHEPAALMKIQSLAAGVGGDEDGMLPAREACDHR
jgi:hypothetical protein